MDGLEEDAKYPSFCAKDRVAGRGETPDTLRRYHANELGTWESTFPSSIVDIDSFGLGETNRTTMGIDDDLIWLDTPGI
ncbi:hypothetical protein ABEW05_006146 [Botrytis cinerea]